MKYASASACISTFMFHSTGIFSALYSALPVCPSPMSPIRLDAFAPFCKLRLCVSGFLMYDEEGEGHPAVLTSARPLHIRHYAVPFSVFPNLAHSAF